MPVGLEIEVRAKLVAKNFEDLTKEIPEVGKGRMRGRLVAAQKKITKYPPLYKGHLPDGFVSEKQRRFFFWALREGVIQVPYKRTGTYGRAWSIERIKDGWALIGFAQQEGKEPYTNWVGGPNLIDQARIHQGRWAAANVAVVQSLKELPKEIREQVSIAARRKGFNAV